MTSQSPVLPEPPIPRRRNLSAAAFWAAFIGWIWTLLGLMLVLVVDVETILFTGPVLLLTGLVGTVMSLLAGTRWCAVMAAGQVGFPLVVFLVIVLMQWGPGPAHWPVVAMVLTYACAAGPVIFLALPERHHHRPAWACQQCGYLLIGLITPRCPECGEPCNLEQVRQALAQAKHTVGTAHGP